jgi:hypothetical protein
MIKSITHAQYRALYTPFPAPPGSLLASLRKQAVETQWYQDDEHQRIGVVVYDPSDKTWNAVVHKKRSGRYQAYQWQISLPTERSALDALMQLFGLENDDFLSFTAETNQAVLKRTGKTLWEAALEPKPL